LGEVGSVIGPGADDPVAAGAVAGVGIVGAGSWKATGPAGTPRDIVTGHGTDEVGSVIVPGAGDPGAAGAVAGVGIVGADSW
jgi:hypothetical protein